jgi:hypothetical protein
MTLSVPGDFTKEIEEAVARIGANPHRFPFYSQGVRYCGPTQQFHYRLYFCDSGSEIMVLAIANPQRKPGYWKRRKV